MSQTTTETNDSDQPLGNLVRRLRREAGLTMFELSRRSGYDRSNLRRIEAGLINSIAPETTQKLADALDADVEAFHDAIWKGDNTYLPSLPTFFRTKYKTLTPAQITEVEELVEQMQTTNERNKDDAHHRSTHHN